MSKLQKRSNDPIAFTLDLVGDKWSLIIIRDILCHKKNSYGDFLKSDERISTNILNDRLVTLIDRGIITYTGSTKRKKYKLTMIGQNLKPLLEVMITFGMKYIKDM
jgi:DNA-binding HxlR family transcriptional regulator